VFQLAEVAVPRALFAAILRRIDRLRGPTRCGGLTGANRRAAGAKRNTMYRDRPAAPEQPGFTFRAGFSGSSHPKSAAGHVLLLTEDRPGSMVPGVRRAHPGNIETMVRMATASFRIAWLAACAASLVSVGGCDRPELKPELRGSTYPHHSSAPRYDPLDLPVHIFAVSPTGDPLHPRREVLRPLEDSQPSVPCRADEQQSESLRLRAQFTCIMEVALAHHRRWTAAGERLNPNEPLRLVVYFNGGLNSLGDILETARDSYREIEHDGRFPVYMAWDTDGFRTWWEDVTSVRNGWYETESALDATDLARPLGDLLQGLGGAPSVWAYSFKQFAATGYGMGAPEYEIGPDEPRLLPDGQRATADKNLLFDTEFGNEASREKDWGYYAANVARYSGYAATGPIRVFSTPVMIGGGEAMWRNMVRRTRTSIRAVGEFPTGTAGDSDRPPDCELAQEPMTALMLQTCYPRGSGGFARFFQWLESCTTGRPIEEGADACPLSQGTLQESQETLRRMRLVMIGHSMGSIVANELLQLFPKLPYESIVYMGGAASILSTRQAVSPVLRQNKGCTNFYNLMLHPMNEQRESTASGFLLSGSLLVYVDEIFENPRTLGDRTVGQWVNIRAAGHLFPADIQQWMLFRVFDRDAGQLTDASGTYRGNIPTTHGEFNDKDMQFWESYFWDGGTWRFEPPGDCEGILKKNLG
jgi:hypothetical protein